MRLKMNLMLSSTSDWCVMMLIFLDFETWKMFFTTIEDVSSFQVEWVWVSSDQTNVYVSAWDSSPNWWEFFVPRFWLADWGCSSVIFWFNVSWALIGCFEFCLSPLIGWFEERIPWNVRFLASEHLMKKVIQLNDASCWNIDKSWHVFGGKLFSGAFHVLNFLV